MIFFFSVQASGYVPSGCPSGGSVPLQSANQSPSGVTSPARDLLIQHGLEKSFWGLRIIEWEESCEKPSEDSIDLAYDWTTCACGKQDPRIPRWGMDCSDDRCPNAPQDRALMKLGNRFGAIWHDNEKADFGPTDAAECLIEIEKRSAEIIAEIEGVKA